MKQVTWTITENTPLTPDTYRLRLAGDTEAITAPGQFVNLKLSGFYLRRPISVCDWEPGAATLIYKVLGHGTAAMTHLPAGTELDVLTGLGNGYDTSLAGERPLLANGTGGMSGPGIFPLAVRMVYQVYESVDIPIVGMGGVSTAEDVLELMLAGATAVGVGAANLVEPCACRKIIQDLPAAMERYGIQQLTDIIGGAHHG